jgi:hypothetical protein
LRAQDGHTAPARSSHLSLREPPWKKTAPAARPGAKVSAAPPGAPPRGPRASPDHPTWWLVPPGAHHGQGGEKNGPERPLGARTKSHSLIRKRPAYKVTLGWPPPLPPQRTRGPTSPPGLRFGPNCDPAPAGGAPRPQPGTRPHSAPQGTHFPEHNQVWHDRVGRGPNHRLP